MVLVAAKPSISRGSAPPMAGDVVSAAKRIGKHIKRTPVLTSSRIDALSGAAALYFKCENFQKCGSFKARGALNAVLSIDGHSRQSGVVTHSSGNHASALAYAARCQGIPCATVMPRDASPVKIAAARGYGARIIECDSTNSSRIAVASRTVSQTGGVFVHPYDDPRVIAGQGTCVAELLERTGVLDAVIAPIGGGGMISGTCLAASDSRTDVIGAEPEQADDAARSKVARMLIDNDAPRTIADGLRSSLSELTFEFVRNRVADVLTVSEEEIVSAMLLVWSTLKIIIEPSSAVAVAAVLRNPRRFAGKTVGIILTGGNVDLRNLPWSRKADSVKPVDGES